MKTGIIVAMDKELQLLLEILDEYTETEAEGYRMYRGRLGHTEVMAMQCGIGKVNAALGTSALIRHFGPDVVINSGVAGGTGGGASILDVVLASEVAYHDVWCGPGTNWGEASGCPAAFACPSDPATLAETLGVKTGLVASGDIFVARKEDVDRILELHPTAMAVDMESGAVAQTCHMAGVPMYCIRVVSDTPGAADNIAQYENFWSDAPQHTFKALRKLVETLAETQRWQ